MFWRARRRRNDVRRLVAAIHQRGLLAAVAARAGALQQPRRSGARTPPLPLPLRVAGAPRRAAAAAAAAAGA